MEFEMKARLAQADVNRTGYRPRPPMRSPRLRRRAIPDEDRGGSDRGFGLEPGGAPARASAEVDCLGTIAGRGA
jgi:hypothetical protein